MMLAAQGPAGERSWRNTGQLMMLPAQGVVEETKGS